MPQEISAEMVAAALAADSEGIANLLVLTTPGEAEPVRVSNWPGGLVSQGEAYLFSPFKASGGGASREEPSRGLTLAIAGVDRRITRAIRAVPGNAYPTASLRTVRVADPDVVELGLESARIASAKVSGNETSATIVRRDLANEPACKANINPGRVPGAF